MFLFDSYFNFSTCDLKINSIYIFLFFEIFTLFIHILLTMYVYITNNNMKAYENFGKAHFGSGW
jgi:hypothetical protein